MQAARDILLRNQLVPAEAAHRLGLLTHLVEASELSDAADALASEVGALEGRAIDQILDLTRAGEDERDMDELVRSLTHSGLHDRIAHYRASQEGGRPTNVDRTSITRSPVSGQAADVG
jgi:enoyl-CoA hydratase/carnithine racemase